MNSCQAWDTEKLGLRIIIDFVRGNISVTCFVVDNNILTLVSTRTARCKCPYVSSDGNTDPKKVFRVPYLYFL
jgi:hypothetical protein